MSEAYTQLPAEFYKVGAAGRVLDTLPRVVAPVSQGRVAGWEGNLAEYLRIFRSWPFTWGSHDCCMHAAAAIKLQTGEDHAADLRWTYTTAKGASAMLRKHYRGSAWNVPAKHGLQPVEVRLAQRGYIVGAKVIGRRALGVCFGAKSYFVGRAGWVTLPTLECAKAWRVG